MFDTMGVSAWLGGEVGRAGLEEASGQRREHLNHLVACPGSYTDNLTDDAEFSCHWRGRVRGWGSCKGITEYRGNGGWILHSTHRERLTAETNPP